MGRVKVVKSDPPESTEILAESIVRLGEAIELLNRNGLNRKGVVVLLHDATKMAKWRIETILDALQRLRGWYCRETKK